jgi:hypothetical protein
MIGSLNLSPAQTGKRRSDFPQRLNGSAKITQPAEKAQIDPFPAGKRKAGHLAARFVDYGLCFQSAPLFPAGNFPRRFC